MGFSFVMGLINLNRNPKMADHRPIASYMLLPLACVAPQVFVELNELIVEKDHEMRWKERARWIKFEEDVEEETERWGKPHVASLSFRSLLELRRTITHGTAEPRTHKHLYISSILITTY